MNRKELPYLFLREHIGGVPAIALARRDAHGELERIWFMVFDELYQRECLFSWLDRHMSSWPVWGAVAAHRGAEAFDRQLRACAELNPEKLKSVMIQTDRAAAYLGWPERSILAFRKRQECQALFGEEPDALVPDGWVTFVNLGGLVRQMIRDVRGQDRGRWPRV
ncbi:MAG: hypothetical protein CNE89_08660 [Sphingomonadaceae bacterium MED-G03]|jgi:hypothetical protein|nr:MAG: hypothetical protein CNE89_08660 [Sphingomonadaceae bacterium MED-G03]